MVSGILFVAAAAAAAAAAARKTESFVAASIPSSNRPDARFERQHVSRPSRFYPAPTVFGVHQKYFAARSAAGARAPETGAKRIGLLEARAIGPVLRVTWYVTLGEGEATLTIGPEAIDAGGGYGSAVRNFRDFPNPRSAEVSLVITRGGEEIERKELTARPGRPYARGR